MAFTKYSNTISIDPYIRLFADAADRLAATDLVADDVGKDVHQLSDDTRWMLKSISPNVWAQIGVSASVIGDIGAALDAINGE
jgi:hypothetical protein